MLINKSMPSTSTSELVQNSQNVEYKDVSVSHKTSYPIIADKVLLSRTEDDEFLIKVLYSQCRLVDLFFLLSLTCLEGQNWVISLALDMAKKEFAD